MSQSNSTPGNCLLSQFVINSFVITLLIQTISFASYGQTTVSKNNDATAPLHLLKPAYVTPYGETKQADVKAVLDKVYRYLDEVYRILQKHPFVINDSAVQVPK